MNRRILAFDEEPAPGEYLVEISPINWLGKITSPEGEVLIFGDTGWRDVTSAAQEDDPGVEWAVVRRVGDSVMCSFEGGELANSPWPQPRNRLVERAFGSQPDPGLAVPSWVQKLEGFQP